MICVLPKIRVRSLAECQQQYLESHQKSLLNPLRIPLPGIAIDWLKFFNQILPTSFFFELNRFHFKLTDITCRPKMSKLSI